MSSGSKDINSTGSHRWIPRVKNASERLIVNGLFSFNTKSSRDLQFNLQLLSSRTRFITCERISTSLECTFWRVSLRVPLADICRWWLVPIRISNRESNFSKTDCNFSIESIIAKRWPTRPRDARSARASFTSSSGVFSIAKGCPNFWIKFNAENKSPNQFGEKFLFR